MKFTCKPLAVALAGTLAVGGLYSSTALADSSDEITALKAQMNVLMKRLDELSKKQEDTSKKQDKIEQTVQATPSTGSSSEPKLDALLKGFYGNFDVSVDYTTKGISGLPAFQYSLSDPANPNSSIVQGPAKGGPVGRVGWMPAISSNKSVVGYRGDKQIGDGDVKFVYQIESSLALTSSPGVGASYTSDSNAVKGTLGSGDTFVGLSDKGLGTIKFGTTYAPYKKATDRLNPFSGQLGDYAAIMGNTGGDNRVEFGTRIDHSIWYESPKYGSGMSFDLLFSPGQNRTYDNVVQSSGSSDCNGGNQPGSGNLPLNCDDGGFDNAFSAALKYDNGPFYATMAYEMHHNVNRNSDGIGSNSPTYNALSINNPSALNGGTQFGTSNIMLGQGSYLDDIGNEWAFKVGAQYALPTGTTVNAIWERMRRDIPAYLQFQNERSRDGFWFAITQAITPKDSISAGWGHAGATPGDPGGQHNYNPLATDNTANMYTLAYKHQVDKSFSWYADWALTVNSANAHYDIGAGGRGLTTDCHDGTNTVVVDYSGTGPTTWGGCRSQGVSAGMAYKF
jgi:predicted porin